MPIAAAIRTAGPTVPVRRGASTQRTTAIPAKRAGRPAGPARRSIHSAEDMKSTEVLRSGGSSDETQGSRLGKRPPTDAGTNAPSIIEPHRVAPSSLAHYVTYTPGPRRRFPAKRLGSAPPLTMTRDLP